jgi:hypothetical protein
MTFRTNCTRFVSRKQEFAFRSVTVMDRSLVAKPCASFGFLIKNDNLCPYVLMSCVSFHYRPLSLHVLLSSSHKRIKCCRTLIAMPSFRTTLPYLWFRYKTTCIKLTYRRIKLFFGDDNKSFITVLVLSLSLTEWRKKLTCSRTHECKTEFSYFLCRTYQCCVFALIAIISIWDIERDEQADVMN